MLIGTLGTADEVSAVADRMSMDCAKALLGDSALLDDLPRMTSPIELLGTEPSYKMMSECVTVLMGGAAGLTLCRALLPKEGEASGLQVATRATSRYEA